MNNIFKPGDKVICIKEPQFMELEANKIYTIKEFILNGFYSGHAVILVEAPRYVKLLSTRFRSAKYIEFNKTLEEIISE